MNYIKGKFKKIIYQNEDTNYIVSLFKVSETNHTDLENSIGKQITVTGIIPDIKIDMPYLLEGEYTNHQKYSWQFNFNTYSLVKPETTDAILDFLKSPMVKGCGKKTAEEIVKLYGNDSLNKIKDNYENLLIIKNMTPLKAMKIYNSILQYEKDDENILKLQKLGFNMEDISKIISKNYIDIPSIIEGDIFLLKNLFDFNKLDNIYINNFDNNSDYRIKECLIHTMMQISFNEGSTYYFKDEIYRALKVLFNIDISHEKLNELIDELVKNNEIVIINDKIYLEKYYEEEREIARYLNKMSERKNKKILGLDDKIKHLQKEIGITYNDDQIKAIKNGLINNVSIISGGPGTGKTTIIKGIIKLYMYENKLTYIDAPNKIALLAPTGRAAKKMSTSSGLPSYTIHRYLRWYKDGDYFEYNEDNHTIQKLIIVDECSMIDVSLMKALLCALSEDAHIILVGDVNQLPSVGPGLVLQDLINSDYFTYTFLNIIYRQSENSYIPFLAKDIKLKNIDEEFMYKRDDYNFIVCEEEEITSKVLSSVKYALNKGLNEDNIQILAPMYKGDCGIDNLNINLQKIYNPKDISKKEIVYNDHIYRENDKVLQLVNDVENNIFNGDIGKIISIYEDSKKKINIDIDFDGNYVTILKKDLKNITHAYAISIHKSQGSEFDHVIIPISRVFFVMLYNKLLYTGVSRAKKSLTLIGNPNYFIKGISNDYASLRKTSLLDHLNELYRV